MSLLEVPIGFSPLELASPHVQHNGPFFVKAGGGEFAMGLRIEEHHANFHGTLHGGVIALLADVSMGYAASFVSGQFKPVTTVSITADMLASARVGDWVEARVELLREGGRIHFAEGHIFANDALIARVSAVFAALRR